VQVIITTAIIMLLMIFYMTAAKSQVDRAKALQDKATAYVKHYSANSQVVFTLLTSDYDQMQRDGWNFHGTPRHLADGVSVALQDLNGLLSLPTMSSYLLLLKTLEHDSQSGGFNPITVAHSVFDWIDQDSSPELQGAEQSSYNGQGIVVRNGPVQSYTELALIKGMTYEAELALLRNTTIHPTPFINPITATPAVLAAVSDSGRADSVLMSRQGQSYDRTQVKEIINVYEDETVNYFVGPGIRVNISAKVGNSYFGRVLEYGVYPYRPVPLEVLNRLPQQQFIKEGI
jgi:hypothetical protein